MNRKKVVQSGQTARPTRTATCRFLVAVTTQTDICQSANNLAKGRSIKRINPTLVGTRVAVRHWIRVWRRSKTSTRVKECKYSKLRWSRKRKSPQRKRKKKAKLYTYIEVGGAASVVCMQYGRSTHGDFSGLPLSKLQRGS